MNGVALDDEEKGNEKSDDRLSTDVKLAVTRIDEKNNVASGDLVAGMKYLANLSDFLLFSLYI